MGRYVNFAEDTTHRQAKWTDLHEELKSFVANDPDVDIQADVINIPNSKQPVFYDLFDKVRDAFIAEEFPALLNEANLLSMAYLTIEQELMQLLALKDILMPNDVKRFLYDPLNQLRREAFDPLFDLLSGKIELQGFISEISVNVNASYKQLYQEGYEKWIALSLMKQFEPDKIYHVPLDELGSKEVIKRPVLAKETLPSPVESDYFCFEVGHRQSLLIPDAIIHSSRLNKYVSFRTEFCRAMWTSNSYSAKREWYSVEALIEKYGLVTIRPDILVYIGDELEDVSLVADGEKICRPDIIVECIDNMNVDRCLFREKLQDISSNHTILNPITGSYLASGQRLPQDVYAELEGKIHLIEVGFEESKLKSIVNAIKI